jgi:hypothetical protein
MIISLIRSAALLNMWDRLNPRLAAITKRRIAAAIPMNGRGDARSGIAPSSDPSVMTIAVGEMKNSSQQAGTHFVFIKARRAPWHDVAAAINTPKQIRKVRFDRV